MRRKLFYPAEHERDAALAQNTTAYVRLVGMMRSANPAVGVTEMLVDLNQRSRNPTGAL